MNINSIITVLIVLFLLALLFVGVYVNTSEGHETDGWKHATETIGPCILARYCPGDITQIWTIDKDDDGVGDGCVLILFSQETFHVKDVKISSDDVCRCPGGYDEL